MCRIADFDAIFFVPDLPIEIGSQVIARAKFTAKAAAKIDRLC
jgi:hypothetical protein